MYQSTSIESASFSGHESFPLRFSWLKKGYDQILEDPSFFGNEDAMVILGTGKNMVRSIRHWGLACQMWEEISQSRGREVQATNLGRLFLADDGWDPHLEDIATIWFLHWLLITNTKRATAWTWTFSRPKSNTIRKEQLVAELDDLVAELNIARISRASLKRDVDVLIRMYTRSTKRGAMDEALDAPFTLLNLMRPGVEKGAYEILQGPQPGLPTPVFEAALVDYLLNHREVQTNTITLDELAYGALSQGRPFRLSEAAMMHHLSRLVEQKDDIYAFDETAGLRQLLLKDGLLKSVDILEAYYRGN